VDVIGLVRSVSYTFALVRTDEQKEKTHERKKAMSLKVRKLRFSKVKRKFKRLSSPMKMPLDEVLDIASKRRKE